MRGQPASRECCSLSDNVFMPTTCTWPTLYELCWPIADPWLGLINLAEDNIQ